MAILKSWRVNIDAYAVEYLSNRRNLVAVPAESMTMNNTKVYFAGYGYPTGIADAKPSTQMVNNRYYISLPKSTWTHKGFAWMCFGDPNFLAYCSKELVQEMSRWRFVVVTWAPTTRIGVLPNNSWSLAWSNVAHFDD